MSAADGQKFELIARSARVEPDLNTRDARLARLSDDPILLRGALAEPHDSAAGTAVPALAAAASGAVAMISGSKLMDVADGPKKQSSPKSQPDEPVDSLERVERYVGAEEFSVSPDAGATREFSQFAMLALSTFGFLALAAVLLFAA